MDVLQRSGSHGVGDGGVIQAVVGGVARAEIFHALPVSLEVGRWFRLENGGVRGAQGKGYGLSGRKNNRGFDVRFGPGEDGELLFVDKECGSECSISKHGPLHGGGVKAIDIGETQRRDASREALRYQHGERCVMPPGAGGNGCNDA